VAQLLKPAHRWNRLPRIGRKVSEQGRSMGMALTSCTVPAVGRPTFTLSED
jgi:dihydroxyacetone kinase